MKRALTLRHPSVASFPRRPVFLALTACLAAPLCLPGSGGAMATTITAGSYTALYGNSGTATPPADDPNSAGNILILGNGTTGPMITYGGAGSAAVGGQAGNGGDAGDADHNQLTINAGTDFTGTGQVQY